MSRRPHEAERRSILAAKHAIDGIAGRAGCQSGHVERRRADDRVGSSRPPPCGGDSLDGFDVAWLVHPLDVAREPPAATSGVAHRAARPLDSSSGRDLPQPLGPLRVAAPVS